MKLLNSQKGAEWNNQRGVALLMALFSIIFISFLATELGFEARSDYQFSHSLYHETKAYYAAKSGVELSLFRIHLFRKAKELAGDKLPDPSIIDKIWQFPFNWPPALGEDASLVAKEDMKKVLEDSLQDAEWLASIAPESSKIAINDLDSPSEPIAKATFQQLTQLIRNRIQQEDKWAEDNSNLDPEEIVKQIKDYIDSDDNSMVGGGESSYYSNIEGADSSSPLPPNRPLRTVDELKLIPGIDDTLYASIAPNISLFVSPGIFVNFASPEVLMSIDPQITAEVAKSIQTHIQGGDGNDPSPFKNEQEFLDFLSSLIDTNSFNKDKTPLVFEEESSFEIVSTGTYGTSIKNIKVKVFDYAKIQDKLGKSLAKEKQTAAPPDSESGSTQEQQQTVAEEGTKPPETKSTGGESSTPSLSKNPPTIVFWEED